MYRYSERLADKLIEHSTLSENEFSYLICYRTPEIASKLATRALEVKKSIYGNEIFIRGLIEFSNFCKNDCLYCGIRSSNRSCERYRLDISTILQCCKKGYKLGFRTFVLQGGEDNCIDDSFLVEVIQDIKDEFKDCAVTLSIGERSQKSYRALRKAGADRYLLRHETASFSHYKLLHPRNMSQINRINCLCELKNLGYQIGAGFMVGSPYQTPQTLAKDLVFIQRLNPDMCGIGPFIPHHATPLYNFNKGTVELTCFLLSILRIICPHILLPATTALGTIDEFGREKGILSGANVVMPNLSPQDVLGKYEIYENKLVTGTENAQAIEALHNRFAKIGCKISISRGDVRK